MRVPVASGENTVAVAVAAVFNCCNSRQTAAFK
jgi:hypothetical protein